MHTTRENLVHKGVDIPSRGHCTHFMILRGGVTKKDRKIWKKLYQIFHEVSAMATRWDIYSYMNEILASSQFSHRKNLVGDAISAYN